MGREGFLHLPGVVEQTSKIGNTQFAQEPHCLIHERFRLVVVTERIAFHKALYLVGHQVVAEELAIANVANDQATLQFEECGRIIEHWFDAHLALAKVVDTHSTKDCGILILTPPWDAEIDPLDPKGKLC